MSLPDSSLRAELRGVVQTFSIRARKEGEVTTALSPAGFPEDSASESRGDPAPGTRTLEWLLEERLGGWSPGGVSG